MTRFSKVFWTSILTVYCFTRSLCLGWKSTGAGYVKMRFLVSVWSLLNCMTFINYCRRRFLNKV